VRKGRTAREIPPPLELMCLRALWALGEKAKAAEPALQRGWIVEAPWDGNLAPLEALDAASLHLEHVLITPALVREVHAGGRRLLAWTVNEAARAQELLDWGVDGIVTDNVREFAERFKALL